MALLALANPKFPVAKAARVLRRSPRPTVAFLWKTFGNDLDNVKFIIHKTGLKTITVYLSCGPCRPERGRRTLWYARSLRELERETEKFADFALRIPLVQWRVVPELEDDFTLDEFEQWASKISKVLLEKGVLFSITRNPNKLDYLPVGPRIYYDYPVELHSFDTDWVRYMRRGDQVSGDGILHHPSLAFVRLLAERRISLLLWHNRWQGLPKVYREIPPNRRTYEIPSDPNLIRLLTDRLHP